MGVESDRFHANLSFCLHAMGQPLTVLRCAVAASAAKGITAERLQHYLGTSAEQVELLCCLFDGLRELVDSSQLGGDRTPVEVSQLLSFAVEDQMPLLQASDLAVNMSISAAVHSSTLADMNRSLKALTFVLRTAASASSQGDVIEMKATPKNGRVEVIIQNPRAQRRSLTPFERLSLAVAEANIRHQKGDYECADDPFRVSLSLPVQLAAENRVLNIAQLRGKEACYDGLAGQLCS
jgi:hypothetical protein